MEKDNSGFRSRLTCSEATSLVLRTTEILSLGSYMHLDEDMSLADVTMLESQ